MKNSGKSTSLEPVLTASYQNANEWNNFNSPKGAIGRNHFTNKAFNDNQIKRIIQDLSIGQTAVTKSTDHQSASSNRFNIKTIESSMSRVALPNDKIASETGVKPQSYRNSDPSKVIKIYPRSPTEEPHSAGIEDNNRYGFRKNLRIETETPSDSAMKSNARALSTKAIKTTNTYANRNFFPGTPSSQLQNNQVISKPQSRSGNRNNSNTIEHKPSMFQIKKTNSFKDEPEWTSTPPKKNISILNKFLTQGQDKNSSIGRNGNSTQTNTTVNTTSNSQSIFQMRKPQSNNYTQSSRSQERNGEMKDKEGLLQRKVNYLDDNSEDEPIVTESVNQNLRTSTPSAADLKQALRQALIGKRSESDKPTELSKNLVHMRTFDSTRSLHTQTKKFTTNTTKPLTRPKQDETVSSSLDGFVTRVSQGDSVIAQIQKQAHPEIQSDEPSKSRLFNRETNSQTPKLNTSKAVVKQTSSVPERTGVAFPNRRYNRANGDKFSSSQDKQPTSKFEMLRQPSQSKLPFTYYISNLYKYHKNPDYDEIEAQLYREHFIQTHQSLHFCRVLNPADLKVVAMKKVSLPKRDTHKDKKTLIFDLDETLIHCNESTDLPYDVKLQIKFPTGEIVEAGINIRPYALEILKEMSSYFEIIVFTASHSCYANVVLDYLDPKKQYIHHRLYRESCVPTPEGVHLKDLRIFINRDPTDLILVDNAAYSFGLQIDNGIPIIPYYDNKEDQELKTLMPFLRTLAEAQDVRELIRQTFKFHLYTKYDSPKTALEKLVLAR